MNKRTFLWIPAVVLVCAVLLAACRSPVEPGNPPATKYGTVRIAFGDTAARTIYPNKTFDAYVYTFTPNGGAPQVLAPVNGAFTLEVGGWNVRVDAYVGSVGPANLAAWGEASFTLAAQEAKVVSITLAADETTGIGTFSWHILYPAGTTIETFTLHKLPGLTEVALNPEPEATVLTGTADVPAGAYLLDIRLANGGLYAGVNEVVYIYALLTTEYGSLTDPVVFEGQDFLSVFTNLIDVAQYLDEHTGGTSAADPILLPLAFDLGIMTESDSGWWNLLDVIGTAGKYVALDLSRCTMVGTEFNPNRNVATGKDKIVSMSLPDVAASIAVGDDGVFGGGVGGSFMYFSSLIAVTAKYVTTIGGYAFDNQLNSTPNLTSVSFPTVTHIGYGAFALCTGLTSVSFSASADVPYNSFFGCVNLTNITLFGTGSLSVLEDGKALVRDNTELVSYPSASGNITMNTITSIYHDAFQLSTNLTGVSFPAVISIGRGAFQECTNLTSVDFPAAISIDGWAFGNCTSLESVSFAAMTSIPQIFSDIHSSLKNVDFPAVTSIDGWAFQNCYNLESVSFPAVTSIGSGAFADTGGTALTITLGATPPTLGTDIFNYVDTAKNVTVQFPAEGAVAYGAAPTDAVAKNWGNAFRGMGWDGYSYLGGTVNGNIKLYGLTEEAEEKEGVTFAYYWVNEQDIIAVAGGLPGNTFSLPFGDSLTITANGGGYINQRWFIDGVEVIAQAGNAAYTFTSLGKMPKRYTVGLIVEKGGKYYNVNFAVTVR